MLLENYETNFRLQFKFFRAVRWVFQSWIFTSIEPIKIERITAHVQLKIYRVGGWASLWLKHSISQFTRQINFYLFTSNGFSTSVVTKDNELEIKALFFISIKDDACFILEFILFDLWVFLARILKTLSVILPPQIRVCS